MTPIRILYIILIAALILTACSNSSTVSPDPLRTQEAQSLFENKSAYTLTPTYTTTPSPTNTPIPPTDTPFPTNTPIARTDTPSPTPTPTPGIGSMQVSEKDGMVLIFVPAGDFIMGDTVDQAMAICQMYKNNCQRGWFTDEEPVHTVYLDAYWIDQTEITNKMYALCVTAGKCSSPSSTESNTRKNYYSNPQYENFPVIYVSWDDANAYCTWAGRRLLTEAEWEKAASWDAIKGVKYTYPWGNTPNDCTISNFPDGSKYCVGDTTAVDSYPNNKSPYGVMDMLGNVWEWVSDWYGARYYWTLQGGVRNPTGPSSGEEHAIRGGDWGANSYIHSADRDFPEATSANFLGFRCAATP